MDLNEVLAAPSEAATQLSALPDDAFDERLVMRNRQNELRALSAELLAESGNPESAEEARRRLESLELEPDMSTRLSHLAGAQPGQGGGIDSKYLHDMHATMDSAYYLAEVTTGIKRLRREVARLEGHHP